MQDLVLAAVPPRPGVAVPSLLEDPARWFVGSYPRFRKKRLLRWLFDHFQSDTAFNLLLSTAPMRAAASRVYFHRKGVFNPPR